MTTTTPKSLLFTDGATVVAAGRSSGRDARRSAASIRLRVAIGRTLSPGLPACRTGASELLSVAVASWAGIVSLRLRARE